MNHVKVRLRPIVERLNLPTVIKTALLPGEFSEKLFIATQVGEVFSVGNGVINIFLDIRSQVIKLGESSGGYDERGLLGIAFHPDFYDNGLFYLHYSVAGTQGPGAPYQSFRPNPCDPQSLNLQWLNREIEYDHIDTVEEWVLPSRGQPQKQRTLLNLRRPFFNHNGVNSLNFSPETGRLVLATGDGGSAYDPFNLAQDNLEICGKIIEIDITQDAFNNNPPVVTRFDELPEEIQECLTVIIKGVRNPPGISFQYVNNDYIKYSGNVGQHLVESIFSFVPYIPIPVTQIVQSAPRNSNSILEGLIDFGWRGWEGDLPTPIIRDCQEDEDFDEKIIAFYDEAIKISAKRLIPLTCYYHDDKRPDKFAGTALTGVQAYMGHEIPELTGNVVFTDFVRRDSNQDRGVLAYTSVRRDNFKMNDYHIIDIDYDFNQAAYFTCLGTNLDQTKLYLGTHGSNRVTERNQGIVYEIVR